ncbi:MAG: ATP-grasp domain-containing protein, partial [Deltaproteobacteria bacterium]|nr:ATP-grasp domain-containing protein [Deltaproteobacteria bacterium]
MRQPVLLLDAVESVGTQVVHALSLAGGYRVTALVLQRENAVRHSWRCRPLLRDDWRWAAGPAQLDGVDLPAGTVLLPVSVDAMTWTVRHRAALAARWRLPLLPPAGSLCTARDKGTLADFAAAHGVAVPPAATPRLDDDDALTGGLPYPVVLKPRRAGGGDGIARYDAPAPLRARLQRLRDPSAYQVQPWLAGDDINCGLLCERGRVLAAVVFRGLTRESAFTPFRSIQFVDDAEALATASRLLAALDWSGLANVDMRRDAGGRVYVLEVNPRAWGNLRGAVAAGLNFPDLWCRTALGAVAPQPAPHGARYFSTVDALALLRDRLRGATRAPLPSWRETGLRFVCRDP